MNSFKLLKQCSKDYERLTLVEAKCNEVFEHRTMALYESAQDFLGVLRAQLASGKAIPPDQKTVNLLAGLTLLSDPTNWAAANLTNKAAINTLDLVGRQADTTARVAGFGSSSTSLVTKFQKELSAIAKGDENAKATLIKDIDAMRLTFSRLKGKVEASQQQQNPQNPKLPTAKQQQQVQQRSQVQPRPTTPPQPGAGGLPSAGGQGFAQGGAKPV